MVIFHSYVKLPEGIGHEPGENLQSGLGDVSSHWPQAVRFFRRQPVGLFSMWHFFHCILYSYIMLY